MKQPRTRKEIEADPRVDEIYHDEDGWWVELRLGLTQQECQTHFIHGSSIDEVLRFLSDVGDCNVPDCTCPEDVAIAEAGVLNSRWSEL